MQTVLITGGSRGIGAAAVRAFVAEGFHVCFLYFQSEAEAQAIAQETGATPIFCNVADSTQVTMAAKKALKGLGHLDVLICCAGVAQQKLSTDITDADWHHVLDVNLSGAFYAARAVLPSMVSRKQGNLVFVSSMWGQVGASMEVHYSAAKAGLIGLTRALAKEVAPSGIRVNCVAPGAIQTDMLTDIGNEAIRLLCDEIPMGRTGTAQEAAQTMLWLCSKGASYITGQVLGVNGGMVTG